MIQFDDFIDVKCVERSDGFYDIEFGEDGDFELDNTFETAINMSLWCERRASQSEVAKPLNRRGWIGNELNDNPGFEYGSKLWLLFQAKATQDNKNFAIDYTKSSLQWFIDDRWLQDVRVTGLLSLGKICLT